MPCLCSVNAVVRMMKNIAPLETSVPAPISHRRIDISSGVFGDGHTSHRFFFFNFLRSLPEKEIRRNSGAENGDNHGPRVAAGDMRDKRIVRDLFPIRSNQEGRDHVRD